LLHEFLFLHSTSSSFWTGSYTEGIDKAPAHGLMKLMSLLVSNTAKDRTGEMPDYCVTENEAQLKY